MVYLHRFTYSFPLFALQSRWGASPHWIPLCGPTIVPTFLFPFLPVTFFYFISSCLEELWTNERGKCWQINLPAEIRTNCNQREVYFVTTDNLVCDRADVRTSQLKPLRTCVRTDVHHTLHGSTT